VHRFNQRQGFLVSAVIHLTLLMMLILHPPLPRRVEPVEPSQLDARERVFLPPNSVLRQIIPLRPKAAPAPPQARAVPAPVPTPPPPSPKDRMSVGPPSDVRLKGPMVLRREDDLTKVAKGTPTAPPAPPTPVPAPPAAATAGSRGVAGTATDERPGRAGLRLPPGLLGQQASGDDGQRRLMGPTREGSSLDSSMRDAVDGVARRMQSDSRLGIPTGTGRDVGGLHFDPQGADFTLWVQRFKDEVYRNWIVPQSALWGAARGHVDFEFTVERSGAVLEVRLLKSAGTAALDRAAQNALSSGRYLPLPDDYRPQRLTVQVTFYYNEGPQGS
jgi:TonB family protein